jgi:hypothetical protein
LQNSTGWGRSTILDGMLPACHIQVMPNLQVKNISASLHQRLRRYARKRRCTIGEIVLSAIERELARSEWEERLAKRPMTELGASAASLLRQEREQRDAELG